MTKAKTNSPRKSPRKHCAKCPWKVGTNPHDIPGEYSEERHKALKNTIAEPGSLTGALQSCMRIMACHETTGGREEACVGWLAHQLGPGNNLALRIRVSTGALSADIETEGPQHETFEDTLP